MKSGCIYSKITSSWLAAAGLITTAVLAGSLWFAPAARSASEDRAARGLSNLLNHPYGGSILTLSEYDRLWTVWEPDWKAKVNPADKLSVRRVALERYGFTALPDSKDLLPIQYIRTGDKLTATCMLCHAGRLPGSGRLLIGLPNTEIDMATFAEDVGKLTGKNVPVDFIAMTRGRTNASFFTHALLSQRNADMSLRDSYVPLGAPIFHDEDAPPWWNVRDKQTLYSDGSVQGGQQRAIMQFAMQGNPDGPTLRGWESEFGDILAYIRSVPSPKYPWPIDAKTAESGKTVFEKNCASCHGTYGANGHYPEKVVPIDVVQTDPARLNGVPIEFRRYYGKSWFGEVSHITEKPVGYVAPPLNGIWASAPYFHNGAVPTLYGVLTEAARPKVFRRSGDYRAYDTKDVGWKVDVLDAPPSATLPGIERRRVVDTAKRGLSNTGHPFGFALSETEKRQVIEYLKTL